MRRGREKDNRGQPYVAPGAVVACGANPSVATRRLFREVRVLIESARERTAHAVNAGLVALYWAIGDRIRRENLRGERAGYGERIVQMLSTRLTREYGRGFSAKNLRHMLRFAEVFPDAEIVSTLWRQLGWSHFKHIIYLGDSLQRDFYAEMCRVERWSVRTLQAKIGGMLYERTAVARKPADLVRREIKALREEDRLSPDMVFRDPYVLDFLGLQGLNGERAVEAAILREMEAFLLELGEGFAFVARQKRISVGGDDFHLDLLFFHRGLRCLVAVELKLERFKPGHKGQMELYLRWLDRHERRPGEGTPVGLILCAGKSDEQVELLELEKSGIRVAEYLRELPPRGLLERKLHQAIRGAREGIARGRPAKRKETGGAGRHGAAPRRGKGRAPGSLIRRGGGGQAHPSGDWR